MMHLLVNWFFFSVSLFIVSRFLPGFRVRNFSTALVASAVYGVLYVLLFKLFAIITFPLMILTLGLFSFVINAVLLKITDWLLDDVEIDGFGTTLLAAFLLALLNAFWRFVF